MEEIYSLFEWLYSQRTTKIGFLYITVNTDFKTGREP